MTIVDKEVSFVKQRSLDHLADDWIEVFVPIFVFFGRRITIESDDVRRRNSAFFVSD
jgi:hypothetical protein